MQERKIRGLERSHKHGFWFFGKDRTVLNPLVTTESKRRPKRIRQKCKVMVAKAKM